MHVEIIVTPTVDTSAYATGDLVTPLMTLANPYWRTRAQCKVDAIVIRDLAAQNAALDVVFFHTQPTVTTFTLNSALDIADAELPFVAGYTSILAAQYCAFADSSVATKTTIGLPVIMPISVGIPTIWAVAISRGSPTYAATDLTFSFLIEQPQVG